MTDLVIAWENWRSSWYNYEDVIIDLINNKDERWLKIVEFISNDTCISLDEYIFRAIKSPKTVDLYICPFWATHVYEMPLSGHGG